MRTLFLLLITVFFSLSTIQCQSKFQGVLYYDIEYDLPEAMEMQRSMLATKMTTYIGKGFTRIEQNSTLGNQVSIYLLKDKQTISLIDLMGQKIAIKQKPETDTPDLKVEEKEDTKEIGGFQCKKAIAYLPAKNNQEEVAIEIYYTTAIDAAHNSQFPGIKGYPTQYQITTQGMTITYTLKNYTQEKVDPNLSKIPKGYEEMTIEEFMKMIGG
jgi:hypothetical protein